MRRGSWATSLWHRAELDADTGNHAVVLKILDLSMPGAGPPARRTSGLGATNRCVWAAASWSRCALITTKTFPNNGSTTSLRLGLGSESRRTATARGLQVRGPTVWRVNHLDVAQRAPAPIAPSAAAERQCAATSGGAPRPRRRRGRARETEFQLRVRVAARRGPSAESPPLHRVVVSPRWRLGAAGGHARSRSGGRV